MGKSPVFYGVLLKLSGDNIKAAILDMDGVLWRSDQPLCDLPKLFSDFFNNGIKVALATNNGTHTVQQYVNKLAGFGVKVEEWQIVTSSMAIAYLVKKDFHNGGPVFIMGSPALQSALSEEGFFHSNENPQAVVAGLNWEFNYDMIKDTSLMIQKGLPFFFTNPDPSYPTPEGNVPGAGAILASLEAATGVSAKLAGKPEPFLFEVALRRLNSIPNETMVIGDRLNTDIKGGFQAGCKTVFVLSGVNSMEDLKDWRPQPDLVVNNISSLFDIN